MKFSEIAKLLDITEDDIDQWIIEASSNGIIDAKIDQLSETVIIISKKIRYVDKAQWGLVKNKVTEWKERFTRIERILEAQPEG